MARLISENCGCVCDSNTALFLLASPNFGQAKHCQKGARRHIPPKGVCSLMYTGLFTFYGPSQYLSSFSRWRLKSKKNSIFTKLCDTQLSFGLSGNHFSASYEASEFCWQIVLNFLQHLRPCHISHWSGKYS